MTPNAAITALLAIGPPLSLRGRARVRSEQPITPIAKERTRLDLLRPSHLCHSASYVERFGPHILALRQWVDRILSGPVGEMECTSERAAAAEWLMEPYVEEEPYVEAYIHEMNMRELRRRR